MTNIEWGGQAWQLRPDRTVYWSATRTLILADPHFGKAQHFRGAGIPVPSGTTQRNLEILDRAVDEIDPNRIVVLGDFFHNQSGVTPRLLDQLREWRRRRAVIDVVNIRGNHDRQAGDPPSDLGIRCLSAGRDSMDPSVAFSHEPTTYLDAVTLSGHLHPGVRLHGRAKSRLRVPCFHFTATTAVLPAFGAFTGMKIIQPSRSDRVFAVGPETVIEVSASNQQQPSAAGPS